MITNDRQYRNTKIAVGEFEGALDRLEIVEAARPAELRRVMREAIESQLEELREQVTEYEALRSGKVRVLELDSLQALPDALIRARIASGLTQKKLAAQLGLKEQQIQRYEATHYAGVSLDRIHAVAEALGITIRERLTLPSAGGS
ncbi:MAG TPA: helix-turn-helix transcriptional regulator [Chloroflexota bacterium]|nr:helix-turn-helix transcriptional regulator [Chloroflexota bacterium]